MLFVLLACSDTTLTTKISNTPPEASIILPDSSDGGDVEEGASVLFRAVVSDADPNHSESLEARWRIDSNPEAICDYEAPDENGESSCTIDITADMEKVTVEVVDLQNALGYDDYILNIIITDPPEIEITAPNTDGDYQAGIPINFEAIVSDTEDSPETLVVTWDSDISGDLSLNGAISELGFFTGETSLPEGEHLLTATVTDSSGKSDSASVEITVAPLGVPVVDFVDIQDGSGMSIDEALDGHTIYCESESTDPDEDILSFSYQWVNQSGTDITIDSSLNTLTLDFAAQGLQAGELLTCNVTVSDGLSEASGSDSVLLSSCSPFATEIPYDGIDSNCDGLEYLNDQDQDGVPDDSSEDYDDDDTVDARLGLECLGEAYNNGTDTVYYLICDNDYYWKHAQDFCVDNGYDSLATMHDDAEFLFVSTLLTNNRENYTDPNGNNRDQRAWTGFTRGPDCSPVSNTNTGFQSVCGLVKGSYYWIDNGDTSWIDGSHWFNNEGDNSVEHCAQLKVDQNTGQVGFWDLYCDNVTTAPHDQWSLSHTRPSMCMLRQSN